MNGDDSLSARTPGETDERSAAAGGPPNEGAPGHDLDRHAAAATVGERDAGRPNEGAPGHEPDD